MSEYNATVTLRQNLTPDLMVLRVKLDGPPFAFEPGQYTVLGLRRDSPRLADSLPEPTVGQILSSGSMIRRAYSITSSSQGGELEFVVTLVRSGSLTPRLFALNQGSRLFVEPRASGVFTLKKSSGTRDLLLVATGSALAPYLSMLRSSFPQNPEHRYVVIHAAAVSWDLAFRAQLESFAQRSKHFSYLPVITDSSRDHSWQGLVGSVEKLIQGGEVEDQLGIPIAPEFFDVFLSGYPYMIDTLVPVLEARGFQTGAPDDVRTNIHIERYW